MIEIPRAALMAGEIAKVFLSFTPTSFDYSFCTKVFL